LQFRVIAIRRLEFEGGGPGPGDRRAFDSVPRHQLAGPSGLSAAAQSRRRALPTGQIGLQRNRIPDSSAGRRAAGG
jgi:hypothetical protein